MDERPGCKLMLYWRSYWSSCGDPMRYTWAGQVRKREQAELKRAEAAGGASPPGPHRTTPGGA